MEEVRRERGKKERRVSPDNKVNGTVGKLKKREEWDVGIEQLQKTSLFRHRL